LTYVGRSQYILGRLPEARQSLEKALSVYPDDYLARIYLGLTLLRSGEDSRGLKELDSGLKGLYDWLEYMNRSMPYTAFWDPRREIRSEIEKDLAMLSSKDADRQQLISSAEWIGQRMEEEIDLVRRDERRFMDREFEGPVEEGGSWYRHRLLRTILNTLRDRAVSWQPTTDPECIVDHARAHR
jgi:tetratricopeptide (TPR) repeat protein